MTKQFNELRFDTKVYTKNTTTRLLVTPEFAGELMTLNDGNRPIREVKVREYAELMTANKWLDDGTPLIISKTGKLLSAQHRLLAIIKSGKSYNFDIKTGIGDECYATIDTNINRNSSDTAHHLGYKNSNNVAYIARFMIAMGNTKSGQQYKIRDSVSNVEVTEWLEKKAKNDLLQQCIDDSRKMQKSFKVIPSTFISALLYYLAGYNKEEAWKFMNIICTGENCSSTYNSPIYVLRQKLININATNGMQIEQYHRLALFIKAWNLYLRGSKCKKIVFLEGEEYPTPLRG